LGNPASIAALQDRADQMVRAYLKAVDGLPTTERIEYFTEIEF